MLYTEKDLTNKISHARIKAEFYYEMTWPLNYDIHQLLSPAIYRLQATTRKLKNIIERGWEYLKDIQIIKCLIDNGPILF